jgi:hypothetical protein
VITLTKLKLAGGEETPRFEATICWRGKPIGVASNGGTGGPSRVWWAVGRGGVTDKATVEAVMREAARVAKRFEPNLFAKLDPEAPGPYVGRWEDALDLVLMHEIELVGHVKALDRACKTHTVVRLHGAKPGQFWKMRGATPDDLARARAQRDVAVVLNDLSSRDRAERLIHGEPTPPA